MTDLDQIDKDMAQKVMGWKYHPSGPNIVLGYYDSGGLGTPEPDWHPTRNIEQAFMVVEKMRELGWTFTFIYGDKGAECMFVKIFNEWSVKKLSTNHSPAEAICRAALAAVTEPTPLPQSGSL